ncbi:MAG: Gfo/Idh/MocA family oxidoreductase [Clostridia bacterium]|nr:Gfo/Idh/MocA family oxidoreductase [Clostridia bacterium]
MYRVGILGTENSHAAAFTKILNSAESIYDDFQVVALYGIDNATSEAIANTYPDQKFTICNSPEEMVDLVDCAMITARHGKYHKPFAMPFIKAGKPVFIDKPFTISNDDAKELLDTAEAMGVPVNGGTGCKYVQDFVDFKAEMRDPAIGTLKNAVMTFAADIHSEYGGFYFYGAHLAEMALNAFGFNPTSVTAYLKNDYLSAVLRYDELDVYLSFAKSYTAIAYGDKSYVFKTIKLDNIYDYEMAHFTEMVRTGKSPMERVELEMTVKLLNAIEQSLKIGSLPVAL